MPGKTTLINVPLIVEKAEGMLWGRTMIKRNLIVETASSLKSLKKKMKALVYDFEGVEIEEFIISCDQASSGK